MPFEDRLKDLDLFSLEKRWLQGNSPLCPWDGYQEERDRFFMVKHGGRIRDYGHNLKQERFRLDMRQNFFTLKQWNRLPRDTVSPSSLEVFMAPVNKAMSNLVQANGLPWFEQGVGLQSS